MVVSLLPQSVRDEASKVYKRLDMVIVVIGNVDDIAVCLRKGIRSPKPEANILEPLCPSIGE
jgi:hypothetical protein